MVRDFVPRQTLIRIFQFFTLPYFDYYSEAWGCLGKCSSDRLQKLQNRAARINTCSGYERRFINILNELGWETLDQKRTKQLTVCIYKK